MKQFRVVAETDRNYPMGLTIDGKRIHVSVKWPGSACSLVLTEEQGETAVFEMAPELRQGEPDIGDRPADQRLFCVWLSDGTGMASGSLWKSVPWTGDLGSGDRF